MRPSIGLLGLALLVAPTVLAQGNNPPPTTAAQPPNDETEGPAPTAAPPPPPAPTDDAESTTDEANNEETQTTEAANPQETAPLDFTTLTTSPTTSSSSSESSSPSSSERRANSEEAGGDQPFSLTGLSTLQGLSIPTPQIPDTADAAFMQKSSLPDGTVFICVGAFLAFLGAAVLAWRGLVAWALHRSVKRAAMAQNLADLKAMSAVPGKKRGMYNVVGASSNMSLDHLAAAPTGTSKPAKPFAANPAGTSPKAASSLFFSPTAGGSTGLRDSMVNRSSTYLPAGYYAAGNAQPASGSPVTQVGGSHPGHLSTYSLQTPGNRFSHRSGVSPPGSPSLPPSRGYDRAPPSRDGPSPYSRTSVASPGTPGSRGNPYGEQGNPSQLSLNVPGGTNVPGGRAPSAYLEDLFENHGNGPRERYWDDYDLVRHSMPIMRKAQSIECSLGRSRSHPVAWISSVVKKALLKREYMRA